MPNKATRIKIIELLVKKDAITKKPAKTNAMFFFEEYPFPSNRQAPAIKQKHAPSPYKCVETLGINLSVNTNNAVNTAAKILPA